MVLLQYLILYKQRVTSTQRASDDCLVVLVQLRYLETNGVCDEGLSIGNDVSAAAKRVSRKPFGLTVGSDGCVLSVQASLASVVTRAALTMVQMQRACQKC